MTYPPSGRTLSLMIISDIYIYIGKNSHCWRGEEVPVIASSADGFIIVKLPQNRFRNISEISLLKFSLKSQKKKG